MNNATFNRRGLGIGALAVLGIGGSLARASVFPAYTPIDVPGAVNTTPFGVSGNNVVGYYYDGATTHGFLWNGSTYTTLDAPGATMDTAAYGVEGNKIVGEYRDGSGLAQGFIYDGTTWQTLNYPGAVQTVIEGISGTKMVGVWTDSVVHGFVYDGVNFTTVDDPLGVNNQAHAIDGNKIVGSYNQGDGSTGRGDVYDGATFTTVSFPGADRTEGYGISGNLIVGDFGDSAFTFGHGYIYDGNSYTQIDIPGARNNTSVHGIDGLNIVGGYNDSNGFDHGFIATVPEPAGLGVCVIAIAGLIRRRRFRSA